jgi:hypothetical protein
MTINEMEQLILAGKSRKEIQGELTNDQYTNNLDKIMAKYNVKSDVMNLEYIRKIEKLFFNAIDMHEETNGIEKFFWRRRVNELGSIYSTYKALTPYKWDR